MELPQIVSLGAPPRLSELGRTEWGSRAGLPTFHRYQLRERVPSGDGDECYLVSNNGLEGFMRVVFLRRFAKARLDPGTLEELKHQGVIYKPGIANIFEVGRVDEWAFVVGEYIEGMSIRELPRIPWLVALAIVHDACASLWHLRDLDAAITPARIRLSLRGEVVLCMGVPSGRKPFHRVLCDVIHPILATAATPEEQRLLRELFSDDDPEAVWVASDALVERHPELDPVLPVVFLALAGRVERASAHAALVERVPIEQLRALWQVVVDAVRSKG